MELPQLSFWMWKILLTGICKFNLYIFNLYKLNEHYLSSIKAFRQHFIFKITIFLLGIKISLHRNY